MFAVPTGISPVGNDKVSDGDVYDLQGRKMGSQLKKGLYIIGNKKVVK